MVKQGYSDLWRIGSRPEALCPMIRNWFSWLRGWVLRPLSSPVVRRARHPNRTSTTLREPFGRKRPCWAGLNQNSRLLARSPLTEPTSTITEILEPHLPRRDRLYGIRATSIVIDGTTPHHSRDSIGRKALPDESLMGPRPISLARACSLSIPEGFPDAEVMGNAAGVECASMGAAYPFGQSPSEMGGMPQTSRLELAGQ